MPKITIFGASEKIISTVLGGLVGFQIKDREKFHLMIEEMGKLDPDSKLMHDLLGYAFGDTVKDFWFEDDVMIIQLVNYGDKIQILKENRFYMTVNYKKSGLGIKVLENLVNGGYGNRFIDFSMVGMKVFRALGVAKKQFERKNGKK
jgi:hypothetical protein